MGWRRAEGRWRDQCGELTGIWLKEVGWELERGQKTGWEERGNEGVRWAGAGIVGALKRDRETRGGTDETVMREWGSVAWSWVSWEEGGRK